MAIFIGQLGEAVINRLIDDRAVAHGWLRQLLDALTVDFFP